MKSRYENNETQKLKDGREVLRSRLYPNIPKSDSDIYVVTQTGDRLDALENQFYGDSSLWWIIVPNNIHDVWFGRRWYYSSNTRKFYKDYKRF